MNKVNDPFFKFDLTFSPDTPITTVLQEFHNVVNGTTIDKKFPMTSLTQKECPFIGYPRGYVSHLTIILPANTAILIPDGACLLASMGFKFFLVDENLDEVDADFFEDPSRKYFAMVKNDNPRAIHLTSNTIHSSMTMRDIIEKADDDENHIFSSLKDMFILFDMDNYEFLVKNVAVGFIKINV